MCGGVCSRLVLHGNQHIVDVPCLELPFHSAVLPNGFAPAQDRVAKPCVVQLLKRASYDAPLKLLFGLVPRRLRQFLVVAAACQLGHLAVDMVPLLYKFVN